MARLWRLAHRYWVVTLTLAVGLLGIVLALAGAEARCGGSSAGTHSGSRRWHAVGMVRDMLRGHWGLDILAVTAIVATVVVGEYVAALIVVLMLTGGEALEDYADRRAKRELDALLTRAPQRAHRIDGPRSSTSAPTRCGPATCCSYARARLVPVDATLRSEEAAVDESSLTGESCRSRSTPGDKVLSGSVNGPAAIEIVATAEAADSQYQQIVALVAEAAESKAPSSGSPTGTRCRSRCSRSRSRGLAWWLSGDPVRFAEVLVLATPCPLLIAAPVAFIGGMSRAARNGVIVKGGGVLERLAAAKTAVFDKTGTLTYGTPALVEIRPERGFTQDELLAAVASAEQYSSHVLATALIEAAKQRGLPLTRRSGRGRRRRTASGRSMDGREVVVGKFAFVVRRAAPEAYPYRDRAWSARRVRGVDGRYAGALLASDRLRDNARETLARLDALGVRHTMILTGDAQETAEHIAAELGVTRVRAELLPADKVDAVRAVSERP